MRSRGVLLAVLLVVAGLVGAALAGGPGAGPPGTAPDERAGLPADQLVSPAGAEGYVWPYTSRRRSITGRTLALNVVVSGEPPRVRRVLTGRSDANWTRDRNVTVRVAPWHPAHGSVRYTYRTREPDATGRWIRPAYQLHVGDYFGQRTHVRAYAAPGDWTAIQAHTEYWDWFRVRHTVTGVGAGAAFVEADLRDEPTVESVSRAEHGHTGGGSAGWWTVVDLVPALLLGVAAVPLGRRLSRAELLLPVALVGVVLGVRAGGLAAEAAVPAANPKLVVVLGYPVLAAGPPAVVAALAGEGPAPRAALLAAAGLGTGIALDMAVVAGRVPGRLVPHRVALVAALGLLALGVAQRDRRVAGLALGAWVLALLAPLLGVV